MQPDQGLSDPSFFDYFCSKESSDYTLTLIDGDLMDTEQVAALD